MHFLDIDELGNDLTKLKACFKETTKLSFPKINIIHLMRNAFDFPSKIIILACNKKLNHDRLGFFNDLSRSTPNK